MIGAGRMGAAAVGLLLLAGCAGGGGWAKPGADPAEAASAYQDCVALAAPAVNRDVDIDEDVQASRGADAGHSAAVRIDNEMMRDSTRDYSDKIIAACMKEKGFAERR